MNVKMLKLGATYYHVTCRGEINQPPIIGGNVGVEDERSNSGAKYTFPSDLRIKIMRLGPGTYPKRPRVQRRRYL